MSKLSQCSFTLSQISYFNDLETPATFGVRNRILQGAGIELLKTLSGKDRSKRIPNITYFLIHKI